MWDPKCYHTSQASTFLRPSAKLFSSQTPSLSAHCQHQVTQPWFSFDDTPPQPALQNGIIDFYHSGLRQGRIKKPQDFFLLWILEKATNLLLTRGKTLVGS